MAKIEIPEWVNNQKIIILYQEKTDPNYSGRCIVFVISDEDSEYSPELGLVKGRSRSISLSSDPKFPGSSILFKIKETNFKDPSNCIKRITIHAIYNPLIEVHYDENGRLHEGMEFGRQLKKEEEKETLRRLGHFHYNELPQEIDFNQTVQCFLNQVRNKDFSIPKLIIPSKK
jgi:hypothetical protein